ncbi:uncharacterized protein LOC130630237 isoform X1 [Hydractinia symbiolongicarpus]|uniref:uncharacterized protein LOC130630237 isoform X1 n=1 Tax=Hydractinia symbiolongicarpus TaxID=13093 RepID=UPI0025516DA0|nr:uncharacterized protein LOC130630237 isoform X1 [Hydractinia symbiolongicarpus]
MEFIIQKQRRLLLMLTYFGFTYAEIYRNGNSFNATFSKVSNNKRLLSGLILSEKSPTIGHCLYKCVLTRTCKSINYYFELNNCELLSNEITDEDVTVESSNGWIHYQTEPSAEQVTPTIKSIVSTTKVTTATSNCAELSPCPHHTCQDTVSSYQCICKFGYTGETCETPPAPSLSSACKSVGDCAVVPGQAIACLSSGRCLCYVGWIGINNVYVRSTTSNYSTSVVKVIAAWRVRLIPDQTLVDRNTCFKTFAKTLHQKNNLLPMVCYLLHINDNVIQLAQILEHVLFSSREGANVSMVGLVQMLAIMTSWVRTKLSLFTAMLNVRTVQLHVIWHVYKSKLVVAVAPCLVFSQRMEGEEDVILILFSTNYLSNYLRFY